MTASICWTTGQDSNRGRVDKGENDHFRTTQSTYLIWALRTVRQTNGLLDGQTKPLKELRKRLSSIGPSVMHGFKIEETRISHPCIRVWRGWRGLYSPAHSSVRIVTPCKLFIPHFYSHQFKVAKRLSHLQAAKLLVSLANLKKKLFWYCGQF